ncbi:MAG: Crp/Fnr family transcriptional regulator [Faecalibacterium sp.]|nr:Crp/Fnr family transcriptional regulator [Faecalibacterium sp.]
MEQFFPVLQRCALFQQVDTGDLPALLHCLGAKVILFEKKYTILAEGNPAKYIGVLLSGSAQIVQIDYYGNRTILSHISPGQILGEAFACAGLAALPVMVIAAENSEVMLLEYQRLVRPCSSACGFHQQLIFNLMQALAVKNILFHQKAEVTAKRTTREKLMTFLLQQAKQAGSNSFQIPFDRQELADYLEVERSGLSAEISKLRREGVLESRKKQFTLLQNPLPEKPKQAYL